MAETSTCVIYNPNAGRGRGGDRINKLRRILGDRAAFWPTTAGGHAEDLALQAAHAGFQVVAAAGGDGTAHEVANGLLRSERPEVIFAVVPVGSANDYAYSLGLHGEWWRHADNRIAVQAVDVGIVRSGNRSRYFINGLGLGFNGAVTLQSRKIKRLQGLPLYGLALLRALLFDYKLPLMTVRLDGSPERSGPTLAFSLANGKREGNFVVAPEAILDDGFFDYLLVGALHRLDLLRFAPGLVVGRLPKNHPKVWQGRCNRVELTSATPLTVHVDGEFFALPGDDCRAITVDLLRNRLRVFSRLPQALSASGSS
jgi:diacylglycerol kinase family enzyme